MENFKSTSLSRIFVIYIVLFGVFVTLISSSFQFYFNYQSDIQNVRVNFKREFVMILIRTSIQTCSVLLFVIFIFYRLIAKHLHQLTDYVQNLTFEKSDKSLILNKENQGDELDRLSFAINNMRFLLVNDKKKLEEGNQLNLMVTREIIERKKIEFQLRESEANLQVLIQKERESSSEKSHFLAMLTHELKSPLATIEFAVANVSRSQNPEITALSFKHIQSATRDMSMIIERCLQADKLAQSNTTLNITVFWLELLIHDVVNESGESKRVDVDIASPILARSDELLCRIVIKNFIENALKYSPEKSIVTVAATVNADPSGILISVCNKIGKAGKPDADKVFQKYYRGSDAQRLRGTGLGLWLVYGIAIQLGGQVNYIEHTNEIEFQLWLIQ